MACPSPPSFALVSSWKALGVSQCAWMCSSVCLKSPRTDSFFSRPQRGFWRPPYSAPPHHCASFLVFTAVIEMYPYILVLLTCLLCEPFKLKDKVQHVRAIVHLEVWLKTIQAHTSTFNSQLARVEGYKGHQLSHTWPGQPLSDPMRWDLLHLHWTDEVIIAMPLIAAVGDFDALIPSPRPDSDFTVKCSSCSCRRWPLYARTFLCSPFPSLGHCPREWERVGQWQHSCFLSQPTA